MELKDYTTEELRAEISRRYAIRKAERESVKRCKQCVHFGEITYFGSAVKDDWMRGKIHTSCRFHKTQNGKYYKVNRPYKPACEYFELKPQDDESKN